jgi:CDGSH-type Zn-finger protein
MAREVIHTADEPYKIDEEEFEEQDKDIAICQCGLSSNFPHCDGSHRAVADEDEGVVYRYDEDGEREVISDD